MANNEETKITPEMALSYRTYEIYRAPVSRNGVVSKVKEKCIYALSAIQGTAKEAFEAFKQIKLSDPHWYYELRVIWVYRGCSNVDVITSWNPRVC